jgi:hypothetical protein
MREPNKPNLLPAPRILPELVFAGGLLIFASGACDEHTSPSAQMPNVAIRAGESGPCDSTPAPRWVLRDKDGNRLQALVEPRCGHGPFGESWSRCNPVDPASSSNFPCVRIIDLDGKFINLQYDLATGQLGPCQGTDWNHDINEAWSTLATFINDQCEGDGYIPIGFAGYGLHEFTRARTLFYAAGDMWYISEAGCVDDAPAWYINSDTNKCTGPLSKERLCPLHPVPAWVKNLLPNPPYTMAVEYE